MGDFIGATDLAPFATIDAAKAAAMIADAEAMATNAAPCISEADFPAAKKAVVKAILRAAILRWNDTGSGAKTSMSALAFSQTIDTTNPRKGLFWPSEIEQLQNLCKTAETGGAFNVDTIPASLVAHAETCALVFGASYCSCGAELTGGIPLYE
ncbi:hypothetical protein IU447_24120 [Nocardia farcinica]|uniref:hypothetical protein n=1 Tax=Nocardia farcinica TaxID=37329 RepID=UPI0018946D3A|nr:hypothetical protein [Nocardia farcinica]MBF6363207.1 hypothetical protein [Nocardia farcinica]